MTKIVAPAAALIPAVRTEALAETFPAILQRAGKNALFAADEFFSAKISNPHTRRAYARPVNRFLAWWGSAQIGVEIQHKAWAVPSGLSRQPGPILRVSMKW